MNKSWRRRMSSTAPGRSVTAELRSEIPIAALHRNFAEADEHCAMDIANDGHQANHSQRAHET